MSFVIVIMMAIVRITTGMGRATVNGAECEFGADCPRQAGPEGADPETDARWRRPHSGSRIPGPGYGARGWEMVCQQFQETLGLGLYRVDGPRIPFPQRQPQRGFSPVQGARLGVRDRPRQCSSVGSAIRRSQPRDRVENDGKKRLAYSISGQDFAVYYFIDVELPAEAPAKLSSVLNITDEVLRYLLVRVDERKAKYASRRKQKEEDSTEESNEKQGE